MESKKERIRRWKLYVIADRSAAGKRDLSELVERAIDGGADVIQYRDKAATEVQLLEEARRLRKVTAGRVPFIVNDSIAVAKACGADGVHLGQDDASLEEARGILGADAIVGRSTHSPDQGRLAQEEGFDYIGVGPVFATPTKPDYVPAGLEYVEFAAKKLSVPFVAIGGIDASNVDRVRKAGAKTVAIVRAVIGAENPESAAQSLKEKLA